jgi:hypothetical protein
MTPDDSDVDNGGSWRWLVGEGGTLGQRLLCRKSISSIKFVIHTERVKVGRGSGRTARDGVMFFCRELHEREGREKGGKKESVGEVGPQQV